MEDYKKNLDLIEEKLQQLEATLENLSTHHSSNLDAKLLIDYEQEGALVYITIIPPKQGGKWLSFDDVLHLLTKERIINIDEKRLKEAISNKEFNKKILIAWNKAPTKGKDAYIKYYFEAHNKDLSVVVPGQLILVKEGATAGEIGISVKGEIIPPKLGNDIELIPGKNTALSADGLRIYATDFGYVYYNQLYDEYNNRKSYKVGVEQVFQFTGDVGKELGNIIFDGKVIIKGKVEGIDIKASGDIEVEKEVKNASLNSLEGSISVGGQVVGGELFAKNDIYCEDVKDSFLKAEGGVIINDSCFNSSIEADYLIADKKRGVVAGGKIELNKFILSKILGSQAYLPTYIKIKDEKGHISCSYFIFPLVYLCIANKSHSITKKIKGCSFKIVGNKLDKLSFRKVNENIPKTSSYLFKPTTTKPFEELNITPSVVVSGNKEELLSLRNLAAELLNIPLENLAHTELFKNDKIYIRVYPVNTTDKPWEKTYKLFPFVKDLNLKDQVAITEKKLEKLEDKSQDGRIEIKLSHNELLANMIIHPPKGGGKKVSVEDAIEALLAKGILEQLIDKETIAKSIEKEIYFTPICVAKGIEPTPGAPAKIEYKFRIDKSSIIFKEDSQGRINFKELNLIENVKKDTVLATKIPPTKGKAGLTVTGKKIEAKLGEDVKLPAGRNTYVSEDGLNLYSSIDGAVVYVNGKVNVEPVLEIKQDVDLHTGNIYFLGTVIIYGEVKDGFKVEALGEINIRGSVGKAEIIAGNNVIINGGIHGEAKIIAGGDIVTKYVENAYLEARNNIIVGEDIMHACLNADNKIKAIGIRSVIVGGIVRAQEEIIATQIGSPIGQKTEIEVGGKPRIRQQLREIHAAFKATATTLERIKLSISALKNELMHKKDETKEKQLSELLFKQNKLTMKLHRLSAQTTYFMTELARAHCGKIIIKGSLYPGVIVTIRDSTLNVKNKFDRVILDYEGGRVKIYPL